MDTCLSSKVVSQNCETISPMAVDAVLGIIDPETATNVDLRDIKVKTDPGKGRDGIGLGLQRRRFAGHATARAACRSAPVYRYGGWVCAR